MFYSIFLCKAHLRGLQERVVQSTRELENSVSGIVSPGSSRGSSPLLHNGGSFEDIGIGGAGLEIEEVSKLEKKLKILEKAESMAVNKVKSMDAEIQSLKSEIKRLLKSRYHLLNDEMLEHIPPICQVINRFFTLLKYKNVS